MNSYHQYIRIIVIFFVLVLALLIWQGYSGYQKFKNFHQQLSERSVTTTAREIHALMEATKNTVSLFARQESQLLIDLLRNPSNLHAQNKLEKKINEYFPKRLTFLLADETGVIKFNHMELLVGNTCRKEIKSYARNNFVKNPVFVHPGKLMNSDHFDVLTPLTINNNKVGVFFISFRLETLRRVLSHGEVVDHHLLLLHQNSPYKIELRTDQEYLTDSDYLPPKKQKRIFYSTDIKDSLWHLVDIPDSRLFNKEYQRLIIQSFIVLFVFMLISGLMLWVLKKEDLKSGKTRGLLSALENERRRIAMDMHDQVLSELSHISRESNHLTSNAVPEKKIIQLQQNLAEVTNNIRAIINDLHPHILDNLGLEATLRDCLQKHVNHSDSPEWVLEIDDKIEPLLNNEQRFNLYRIILENINNIQKHANCTQFAIQMTFNKPFMKLLIIDNGVGFDNSVSHNRFGLTNIEARSRLLNAKINWNKPKKKNGSHFELKMRLTDE